MRDNNGFRKHLRDLNVKYDQDRDVHYIEEKGIVLENLYLNGFRSLYFSLCEDFSLCDSVLTDSYIFGEMMGNSLFENTVFYNCNFNKLVFNGTIRNCKFIGGTFFETMLNGTEVDDCLFYKCNFSGVDFSYCKIARTDFVRNVPGDPTSFVENEETDVHWSF